MLTTPTDFRQSHSQVYPSFCSSIVHVDGNRKHRKNREGLVSFIMSMTSRGRDVDVGGVGSTVVQHVLDQFIIQLVM